MRLFRLLLAALLLLPLAATIASAQTSIRCPQAPNLACSNSAQTATQTISTVWNLQGSQSQLTLDGTTADANKITISLSADPAASFTMTIPAGAASAAAQAASCSAGQHVSAFSATTGAFTCTADSAGTSALLSATHTDTVTHTVVRGDIIVGNATPAWAAVAIGAANTFFHSNGTDGAWAAIAAADIGPGDLANALTWNEVCTASPCTLAATPRSADTALVFWRTLKLRRAASCAGSPINEYTLSGATLTLCDSTGIGAGVDGVQVTYEL